jgi:epsin
MILLNHVAVRHRAKEIVELIHDQERLKDERNKAEQNRNKYKGVAADDVRNGSSSFSSSNNANNSKYGGFGSDSYTPSATSTSADARRNGSNENVTQAALGPRRSSSTDAVAPTMSGGRYV